MGRIALLARKDHTKINYYEMLFSWLDIIYYLLDLILDRFQLTIAFHEDTNLKKPSRNTKPGRRTLKSSRHSWTRGSSLSLLLLFLEHYREATLIDERDESRY